MRSIIVFFVITGQLMAAGRPSYSASHQYLNEGYNRPYYGGRPVYGMGYTNNGIGYLGINRPTYAQRYNSKYNAPYNYSGPSRYTSQYGSNSYQNGNYSYLGITSSRPNQMGGQDFYRGGRIVLRSIYTSTGTV